MKSRSVITNATLAGRPDLGDGASVGLALAHDSAARHVRGTAAYIDDVPEPARNRACRARLRRLGARGHPFRRARRGARLSRGGWRC